jgi:hypothetical protein
MGDLIQLPAPTPRVRDYGRRRDEEPYPAALSRLPPRGMTSWAGTITALMRCGSSRRPSWNCDDRHLIAATNALLADRAPTGVPLSFDDAKALRFAIALRNRHPGGGAPTPTYVDETARLLRTSHRAICDDPNAPEFEEPNQRHSSNADTDGQLRVRVGY